MAISSPNIRAIAPDEEESLTGERAPAPFEVVIVDPDPKYRSRLATQLGGSGAATFPSVDQLLEHLQRGRPTVVVFGPGLTDATGLSEIERVTRSRPQVAGVLVADELSTALLQQALRSGVRDVLASPMDSQVLQESVERVGGTLTVVPAAPVVPGQATEQGRVIAVTSTKGGSGKSVVATNLAVLLARRSDRPVVLVDADLQFGDVAVLLRLNAAHTIVDAVSSMDRLDAQLLQSLLVRHETSGLYVLAAPLEPSFAERVTGDHMMRIIKILQEFCAYVVVDTPAQFNDVVLALIEHSDDVILVGAMDIPTIKNVKLGLQTLRMLQVPESKLHLVLNRANSKVKLDVGEVEQTLALKAEVLVPSDIVVPQTVNKGIPLVLDAPKSEVARSFERLADLFSGAEAGVPMIKAKGRFGRF
jgi:pilus assembly protein CpaE